MRIRYVTASALLLATSAVTAGAQQRRPAEPPPAAPRRPAPPEVHVYVVPRGDTIVIDRLDDAGVERWRRIAPADSGWRERLDRTRALLERRRSSAEQWPGFGTRVPDELREQLRSGRPLIVQRMPEGLVFGAGALRATDPDRAMIGVSLGDASTDGIPVAGVANDGPADRAGIRTGDLLVAVGDASLRVLDGDAGDPLFRAAVAHRLTRLLDTLPPGATVTLRVRRDGDERTLRVRTVRAAELNDGAPCAPGDADCMSGFERRLPSVRSPGLAAPRDRRDSATPGAGDELRAERMPRPGVRERSPEPEAPEPLAPRRRTPAMKVTPRVRTAPGAAPLLLRTESSRRYGLGLTATGSPRDTLGVFVASVRQGSAADQAGIVEGMRVAAVDGTSLRVQPEDAGDVGASSAMLRRLQRALADAKSDRPVRLRVWDGARWREVEVR